MFLREVSPHGRWPDAQTGRRAENRSRQNGHRLGRREEDRNEQVIACQLRDVRTPGVPPEADGEAQAFDSNCFRGRTWAVAGEGVADVRTTVENQRRAGCVALE